MDGFSSQDSVHMARALHLAERGRYTAHPNPVVGCVIARGDDVVGEGWHVRAGDAHAEVNALRAAGDKASGATAYVTLEPCAHHGRTPPCVFALIGAGVSRVVVATGDPFPDVAGKGIDMLRSENIQVDVGLMESAARQANAGFIQRVTCKQPLVRLKLAASLDGAVGMADGESQWITGPEARADVQKLRARSGAVLTGIGTVLADDPSLNVRDETIDTGGLQPLRVVLDSRLRTPPDARMLTLPGDTLICCVDDGEAKALREAGAEVRSFPSDDGGVAILPVLEELAHREINEVLVEAGPGLAGQLLEQKLVDELVIYQAPHIMGNQTRRLVDTPGWTTLSDRLSLDVSDVRRVGADTRITARIRH